MNIIERSQHVPIGSGRLNCPCQLAPLYQTKSTTSESRTVVVHQYTTMRLVHRAKNGEIKNILDLRPIHDYLASHGRLVETLSGASNVLVASISFNCLIRQKTGEVLQSVISSQGGVRNHFVFEEKSRKYITFDLKIPGANTGKSSVFSYDFIEKQYGGKKELYKAIKLFYEKGRSIINYNNKTHGHHPDYDPKLSKHDQYIRHTEQLLVAYLALPEAATMLCNRLRAHIRGTYPDATSVKVYNTALHLHSKKRCCAPCEYAFIGLMNDENAFLNNFKNECSLLNGQLSFAFPQKKSIFQLAVTVSADQVDADHKKAPLFEEEILKIKGLTPTYDIFVKNREVAKKIFTTLFQLKHDNRRVILHSNLTDITVVISGSDATKGSPVTKEKVNEIRKKEMEPIFLEDGFVKVFRQLLF